MLKEIGPNGAFPLQELVGRFRGAGTFRKFSTAGTAPVRPFSWPFTGANEVPTPG